MFDRLTSKIDDFFTEATRHEQASEVKLDFNSQMSVERTVLAHERTLMA
jgi:hypothetical protein